MEVLICYCLKCKSELARFRNSWDAIGSSYHSPTEPPVSVAGIGVTGLAYGAAPESSIENSSLQDVACRRCQTTLGLQCYSAPPGHLLKKEQLILNLSLTSVVSERSRKKAIITVLKSIPLVKGMSRQSSVHRKAPTPQSIVRSKPQSVPPPSRPPVPLFNATPSKVLPSESRFSLPPFTAAAPPSDAEKFRSWAEDAIRSQQKDIDRVSGTVDRIERDMQVFKDFMEGIRSELVLNREMQNQARHDLDRLQNQVDSRPRSRGGIDRPLATEVALANQKIIEVDQVKCDLEKMNDRLRILEQSTSSRAPRPVDILTAPECPLSKPKQHPSTPMPSKNLISTTPRHITRKTKLSDNDVDDDMDADDELAANEVLGVSTLQKRMAGVDSLKQHDPIPITLVPNDGPVLVHGRDDNFANQTLHSRTPSSQHPKRRLEVDHLVFPESAEQSTGIPSRSINSDAPSSKKQKLDMINSTPDLGPSRRNSEGMLITRNGNIDRRSLRRKHSTLLREDKHRHEGAATPVTKEMWPRGQDEALGGLNRSHADPITTGHWTTNPERESRQLLGGEDEASADATYSRSTSQAANGQSSSSPLTKDRPFRCGICNSRYNSLSFFNYHKQHAKGCGDRSKDEVPKPQRDRSFKCGSCHRVFRAAAALQYHRDQSEACTHDVTGIPTCPRCGKRYKLGINLKRHLELGACTVKGDASDVEGGSLACAACKKRFGGQGELDRHQCSRVKARMMGDGGLVERERLVRQTLERELMEV